MKIIQKMSIQELAVTVAHMVRIRAEYIERNVNMPAVWSTSEDFREGFWSKEWQFGDDGCLYYVTNTVS